MVNWQVLGQLIATGVIMLAGPAIIILLALKKGNL
jgi:Photosystem II complex subunit Ycf12